MGFFKTFDFLSSLVDFSGVQEAQTLQHSNVLVGLGRPSIGREVFSLSAPNLKDIPYNGDSC